MSVQCIIFYDGVCKLCNWWVRFLIKRDTYSKFGFVPIGQVSDPQIVEFLKAGTAESVVVFRNGSWFYQSDAVLQVVDCLPVPWRWAKIVRLLPKRARDWVYSFVARIRYPVFGKFAACPLVPPEYQRHFPDPDDCKEFIQRTSSSPFS